MTGHNQAPNYNQPVQPIDDPSLLANLARDPLNRGGMPPDQRHDLLKRVGVESRMDAQRHRKIVTGPDNELHWAAEYPRAMTLAGQLRGDYEYVHPDVTKRPAHQHISGPAEGDVTHVLVETADGEMLMIQKTTPNALSAQDQRFTIASTRSAKQAATTGRAAPPREIDTNALKDVVLVVGEPMQLGYNKATDSYPRTQAAITRITGMKLGDKGIVAQNHPHLQQPNRYIDAYSRFDEAMQDIQRGQHAQAAGSTMLKGAGASYPAAHNANPQQSSASANQAPQQPTAHRVPKGVPPQAPQPKPQPQPAPEQAKSQRAEHTPPPEVTPKQRAFAIEMLERGLPFEGEPDTDPARTMRLDELLTAVEAGDTYTVGDVLHFVQEIVTLQQQRPDMTADDVQNAVYQRYFDAVKAQAARPVSQWTPQEKQAATRAMTLADIMGKQPPAIVSGLGKSRLRRLSQTP